MLFQQYQPIVLPIDYGKGFFELSEIEVDNYYKWFLENKESRLIQLYNLFFIDVVNPLSEDNFNIIEWVLRSAVSCMPKAVSQSTISHYQKVVLDERTFSICYDIAIFLGELIVSINKDIHWEQEKNRKYVDYGQPILMKKKNMIITNPFKSTRIIALKIYNNTYKKEEIKQMFNYWKKTI